MREITRDNVEHYLDHSLLYAGMRNGRWWQIRRNGATKRWKKDASRIRIPVKAGLRSCTAITESDFNPEGFINTENFRHVDDVPIHTRP